MSYLDEAMALIAVEERFAYELAVRLCPDLIPIESNPLLFLRRAHYNPYAAAQRLVAHWKLRYETFGADRAFRSLFDLSGLGALSPTAVAYHASGVGIILPPDDQGRPVFFVDRSRLPAELLHVDNLTRFQCSFYALALLLLKTSTPSFVVVLFFTSRPRFFPASGSWFLSAVEHAFPLKLDAILVTCRSPRTLYKQFMATFVPVILKIANRNCQRFNITIDVGEPDELLKKLLLHGMHAEQLPKSVGGTWMEPQEHRNKNESAYHCLGQPLENGGSTETSEMVFQHDALPVHNINGNHGLQLLAAAVEMGETAKVQPKLSTKGDESCDVDAANEAKIAAILGAELCVTPSTTNNNNNSSSFSITKMENALSTILPRDKRAFQQAMILAHPALIHREASAQTFVDIEGGDYNRAAHRVVNYWNLRQALFADRAFLHMNQSEGGALISDDLKALKSGYLTILPPNKKDQVVLCCDASRLSTECTEARLRCLMYMLHAALDESMVKNGIAILFVMNKLSYERTSNDTMMSQVLHALPLKVASMHIVRQPARLGERIFYEKVVPTLTGMLQRLNVPILVHSGSLATDLRIKLAGSGFAVESLPRSLGGGWMYQDFQKWMDQRLEVEANEEHRLFHDKQLNRSMVPDGCRPSADASPTMADTLPFGQAPPFCPPHTILNCTVPPPCAAGFPVMRGAPMPVGHPRTDMSHIGEMLRAAQINTTDFRVGHVSGSGPNTFRSLQPFSAGTGTRISPLNASRPDTVNDRSSPHAGRLRM